MTRVVAADVELSPSESGVNPADGKKARVAAGSEHDVVLEGGFSEHDDLGPIDLSNAAAFGAFEYNVEAELFTICSKVRMHRSFLRGTHSPGAHHDTLA